jgi:3-phosphoshikimate 1-carboxyvinyltransferase
MGKTSIIETRKTRDHTEILLKYLKVQFKLIRKKDNSTKLVFNGPYEIKAKNIFVAGDPSSAAFFIVAALIVPNSKIILKNICLNKTRIEYINILKKMGAKIKIIKGRTIAGELIGSIQVTYSKLKAVNIPKKLSPYLIDEYPILSIAASVAKGTTKMKGLEELRYKESDRIKSIYKNLRRLKIDCSVNRDDISITGSAINPNGGIKIKTFGDHRIAMSFKVMSLICNEQLSFDDLRCINISYPDFNKHLESIKVENDL